MKLNLKKVFYVGVAFFLITLFWQTYDSIITKILIDKFGLNQTWSGVVMAFDNVLALVLLPLFGGLSDKTNSKYGRRTPYIVIGTVLAAFAFLALSFSDSYQTVKIQQETSIIENYELYQEERNVMNGAVLTGGVMKIETILAKEYEDYIERATAFSEWNDAWETAMLKWSDEHNPFLLSEADAALASGAWNQTKYDNWLASVYNPMVEIATNALGRGFLTQKEYLYWVDEVYDAIYDLDLTNQAWALTSQNPATFIIFAITLFIALVTMSTFRSPAVALMPDVTIKPLRSKANAVINLMGTVGGILAIVILTVFALDNKSYVDYTPAFITVSILMLLLLAFFMWKVREPKLVQEKMEEDALYGLSEESEAAEEQVGNLAKDRQKSLYLILISVFLWFIGYNAVTTKLSDYAPKVLGIGFSMPLLIAQGAALLAFIPIGIIATKIGRRKAILIGIVILSVCFGSVFFLNENISWLMNIIFAFTGIGWATINVNSYPMVVELSKGSNVGKYTGYYYTFSMSAQIITPILSGILMDEFGRKALFPYATLFVALAFITMLMVRHGDAKVIKKASVIENFDVDMD
ncbi:MAG: MFS transporter [Candidatus Izemoplasmatales bacterium]|nr:MFS transporter [bacterium]MDZ4196548.1 MFS transporter [Candidatus Izemoplasmatales bacterium]